MRAPIIDITVLIIGLALSLVGVLGAAIVGLWAGSGWHGLTLANTWPAIGLLAWAGLCGLAVCRRLAVAKGLLVAWAIAGCIWLLSVVPSSNDGSWLGASVACVGLSAVVGFVVWGTSEDSSL